VTNLYWVERRKRKERKRKKNENKVKSSNEEEINLDDLDAPATGKADATTTEKKEKKTSALGETTTEEKEQPMTESQLEKLDPRRRKLFELRLLMNKARRSNKQEQEHEHKRLNTKPSKKGIKEWLEKKEAWQKELAARGESPEFAFMHETAEVVEYRQKKQGKKKAAPFGWDVFNQDTQYKAYTKRQTALPRTDPTTRAEDSKDVNSLDYASNSKVNPESVDRMVAELKATKERRSKFSRRRPFHEDHDVDYINERNRVFNKKVKRAYDKYTAEIRANLERGTAL